MKMPQLNRKYPSGAAKRNKMEKRIKVMKNVKVSWTGLLLSHLVVVGLQKRVQLQAPKSFIVAMSV